MNTRIVQIITFVQDNEELIVIRAVTHELFFDAGQVLSTMFLKCQLQKTKKFLLLNYTH